MNSADTPLGSLKPLTDPTVTFNNFKNKLEDLTAALKTFEKNELKLRKDFGTLKISQMKEELKERANIGKDILTAETTNLKDRLDIIKKYHKKIKENFEAHIEDLQTLESQYLKKRNQYNKEFFENTNTNFKKINKALEESTTNISQAAKTNKMGSDERRKENQEKTATGFYRNEVIRQNEKRNELIKQGNSLQEKWWKWTKAWEILKMVGKFLFPAAIVGLLTAGLVALFTGNKFLDVLKKAGKYTIDLAWGAFKFLGGLFQKGFRAVTDAIFGRGASTTPGSLSADERQKKFGLPYLPPLKTTWTVLKSLTNIVDKNQIGFVRQATATGKKARIAKKVLKKGLDFISKSKLATKLLKPIARMAPILNSALVAFDIMEATSKTLTDKANREMKRLQTDIYGKTYKDLQKNKYKTLGIEESQIKELDIKAQKQLKTNDSYMEKRKRWLELQDKFNKGKITEKETEEMFRTEEMMLAQKRQKMDELYHAELKKGSEEEIRFLQEQKKWRDEELKLRKENREQQERERFERKYENRKDKGFFGNLLGQTFGINDNQILNKMKELNKDPKVAKDTLTKLEKQIIELKEKEKKEPEKGEEYREKIWLKEKLIEELKLKSIIKENESSMGLNREDMAKFIDFKGSAKDIKNIQKLDPRVQGFLKEVSERYYTDTKGKKLPLLSAYRSPEFDSQVGTSKTPGAGPHTEGRGMDVTADAADFIVKNYPDLIKKYNITQGGQGHETHLQVPKLSAQTVLSKTDEINKNLIQTNQQSVTEQNKNQKNLINSVDNLTNALTSQNKMPPKPTESPSSSKSSPPSMATPPNVSAGFLSNERIFPGDTYLSYVMSPFVGA